MVCRLESIVNELQAISLSDVTDVEMVATHLRVSRLAGLFKNDHMTPCAYRKVYPGLI